MAHFSFHTGRCRESDGVTLQQWWEMFCSILFNCYNRLIQHQEFLKCDSHYINTMELSHFSNKLKCFAKLLTMLIRLECLDLV